MPTNPVSQLARKYRKLYPGLKFRIVTSKTIQGAFATTHLRPEDGTFVITFPSYMDPHLKCFLLAHEVAHALSWHMDEEEHGEGFWSAYRKTYDVYAKFCD